MKLLVATTQTKGQRANDFCHVPEGEILTFGSECDREPVDGRCGCRRALVGVECHRATTVFKVVDLPDMSDEKLAGTILESLKAAGWVRDDGPEGREWAKNDARELSRLADVFPVGGIVERRGNKFQSRTPRAANPRP